VTMAETGQLGAWVGREKEDGHITRGAIAPN
jgi:hypothetical protein